MTSAVAVGLGLAAIGLIGRAVLKHAPQAAKTLEQKMAAMPKSAASFASFTDVKYYKGGFESKMTRREAALILGVSPNAQKLKIKEAHKRIMLLNHPDRGGSPFIASKLNEAKELLEKKTQGT